MRVTTQRLEALVERLNACSKCKYQLEQSYGRTRVIVRIPNSAGCINDVTYNLPKGELESVLDGILRYLETEKKESYHIATCEHEDRLNGEKNKQSVIHKVNGKKWCSACGEIKDQFTDTKVNLGTGKGSIVSIGGKKN